MGKLICFGLVLFLVSIRINAQQSPHSENANNQLLDKDWSDNEANVLKKRKNILMDTMVFDFDYEAELSNLMDNHRTRPISSKAKAVEMPNYKPESNSPMTIIPIDTTSTFAARIYKY